MFFVQLQKSSKANFDASRDRLDATISSLLEDKRNLEEKLCLTNEIVKKLEADLRTKGNSSTNLSFDSNASSTSPSARKSLDREPPQPRVNFDKFLPSYKVVNIFLIFRNL